MNTTINFNGFIDPYQDESSLQTASTTATTTISDTSPYRPFAAFDPASEVEALREVIRRVRGK